MKKYNWFASLILVGVMTACGGGNEGGSEAEEPSNTEQSATEMEGVEYVIEGNDQMKFNLDQMKAKPGQTVTVTLKNVGELPIETMGHNWTLFNKGVDVSGYASEAISHKEDGHQVPDRIDEDVIAYTSLLGPGQSETITFTAPTAPGIYKYACTFPGHAGIMKGTFLVQ